MNSRKRWDIVFLTFISQTARYTIRFTSLTRTLQITYTLKYKIQLRKNMIINVVGLTCVVSDITAWLQAKSKCRPIFVKIKKNKWNITKTSGGSCFVICRHTDGQTRKGYPSLLATARRVRRKRIQLIALCFFCRVQNLGVQRTCLFFSMLLMFSTLRTLGSTFCYIVWVDRTFDELSAPSAAPAPVVLAYVAVPKALK
jgi:hypothetical protein